jgi:hypothetical protein
VDIRLQTHVVAEQAREGRPCAKAVKAAATPKKMRRAFLGRWQGRQADDIFRTCLKH